MINRIQTIPTNSHLPKTLPTLQPPTGGRKDSLGEVSLIRSLHDLPLLLKPKNRLQTPGQTVEPTLSMALALLKRRRKPLISCLRADHVDRLARPSTTLIAS